jgi:hypothetical protein
MIKGRIGLTVIWVRHWASLGAWVTLLLLAVDPFWQAVIQYSGQLVRIEHGAPSILTSRQINVGDWYKENTLTVDYHGHDDSR